MKIYVFGDSFSVDFDDDCLSKQDLNITYPKWKKYVPKKYYHYLAEEYKCEIINKSKCGIDNDTIFEFFLDSFSEITSEDILIFGWTQIQRFTICNNVEPFNKNPQTRWSASSSYIHLDWVRFTELNRDTVIYYNRQLKIIEFINKILPKNIIIQWTWSTEIEESTITWETKNEVIDYHYNEKKHKELYTIFCERLKNEKQIIHNLWRLPSFNQLNIALNENELFRLFRNK